ncbi:MAG: PAS domain S-box protein [Gammaproteobacteria bacterium]|nr:PAS domain S-box protein [Gammaproteobacteria bacterium]
MISDNKEHDNPDASDLYDAYPDAVLMLAPDGRILHANRSAEERYGYSREQLMLMNVAELAAANLNDQILTHLHPALNSAIRFESKLRCQDGSELAVDIFARPIDYRGEKATIAGVRDITELRRIELSQRESEDKLRLFINYAPSAIAMFDRDMRYIVHSHRWLVDYHLPEQDLIGRSHYEIFPELPERWKQIHTSSLAGTVEKCDEDPFPRADGSVDWVHWETRPWRTSDGDIGGIIIFSEVITERKQAEMKLRESEGRFRVLFEQAGVGVAQINTITGQFVRINQKYSDIVGYSRAEMEQLDFHKITHPDDLPADLHNMELLKAGRKTEFTMEKRYFHKNGSLVWVTLTVSPMWSAGEPPSFHVAVVEDISERKQAEKALIESERRYRQLFENMSSGFVLYEVIQNDQGVPVDLQIIAANAKYEQTTGLSIEHVVGKRLTHVLPGIEDDAADWIGIFGKVALTGDAMQFEHDSELLGFYYNISAYQAGPKQCAVNFLDITGRRQAEKALEKSRKLLAETEQIGKVGGWEFNIDTGKQTWTEEIYHIHELAIDYDPSLEEGINFYTPESRPIIEQAVQRVIEHAEPFDLELEIITAKGNLRNVHAIGKADLEQRRVYGFFQDITDAKQAEKHILITYKSPPVL